MDDWDPASLPKKRVAADCLIRDENGRVLLVQPTYKQDWDLPGGVVETDESPRDSARREVAEETGLPINPGRLLAVDWVPGHDGVTEVLALLYDGGRCAVDPTGLRLPADEVRSARFADLAEAEQLLDRRTLARVSAALTAADTAGTVYLEAGEEPTV